MVLNLHGSQSDAEMQVDISDMDLAAEKYNFIAVSIQGILPAPPGYRWNVPGTTLPPGMPPDDEQFLSDTIDYVQSILCVDAKRVYGTGYSGGGRMISQYACDHPDRIAAIAPVVGLRAGYPISGQNYPDPATCTPSRPVPVVTFAGTDDMVNPYAGGGAPYWQYSAEAALKRWAEINSCNQELRTKQITEHVKLLYYSACNENAVVQMYVADGAGHTWPGSEFSLNFGGMFGEITFEIEATDLMWQFFELHHLPGSPN
jgi:polyhydroxybutyrate depolymerase